MPYRAIAAALMLVAGLVSVPLAGPSPVAGIGPLPDCRIDDVLTVPRGYDDWRVTLVDWILSVGPDYKPPDLVSVRNGGVAGGGLVRQVAIDDLRAMATAAKKNGTPLVAFSPYRGYKQQKKLFNDYASGGYDDAIKFSARPGHSEHQLGTTIDFIAVGDHGLTSNWEVTRTGGWMAKNAWKYGWLMTYPKGKIDVACYSYEPWHYRYFGRELAATIHESGLTPREYLWANYTMVDPVTGLPLPSATIAPSTPPSQIASPLASPAPVPSGTPGGGTAVPVATPAPTLGVGTWFGLDPPLVVAGLLLALALVGFVVSLGYLRRSRRG